MKFQTARLITRLVILISVGGWLVWDVYVVIAVGAEATESVVIKEWMRDYPQIVALTFFVLGHWTWPLKVRQGEGYVEEGDTEAD